MIQVNTIKSVAEKLHTVLRPHGFIKKGLVWNRSRDAFVDVIALQKAKFSTPVEQTVTMDLAICVPDFRQAIFGKTPKTFIEADGVFTTRISEIMQKDGSTRSLDRWWAITPTNVSEVGSELAVLAEKFAVQFLSSFKTFQDIEAYQQRLRTLTDSVSGVLSWGYDDLDQVTQVQAPQGRSPTNTTLPGGASR
jgi:hypothetical protein